MSDMGVPMGVGMDGDGRRGHTLLHIAISILVNTYIDTKEDQGGVNINVYGCCLYVEMRKVRMSRGEIRTANPAHGCCVLAGVVLFSSLFLILSLGMNRGAPAPRLPRRSNEYCRCCCCCCSPSMIVSDTSDDILRCEGSGSVLRDVSSTDAPAHRRCT